MRWPRDQEHVGASRTAKLHLNPYNLTEYDNAKIAILHVLWTHKLHVVANYDFLRLNQK